MYYSLNSDCSPPWTSVSQRIDALCFPWRESFLNVLVHRYVMVIMSLFTFSTYHMRKCMKVGIFVVHFCSDVFAQSSSHFVAVAERKVDFPFGF